MGKKLKRGARGSTEDEGSNSKRLKIAATNTTDCTCMVAGSDDEASNFTHDGQMLRATTTNLVFMRLGVC